MTWRDAMKKIKEDISEHLSPLLYNKLEEILLAL